MNIKIEDLDIMAIILSIIMMITGGFVLQGIFSLGNVHLDYWRAEGIYLLLKFVFDI